MTEDYRVPPEEYLSALRQEEWRSGKGKLKIFFGMSAGVGKTYAMLEDAQQRKREGENLVIGVINTHGRQETARLLEGLSIVPLKNITYKGTTFEEMDLDEILKIKPSLVLVDELAHSNVPGTRHPKRWQDVLDILDAGIDVYTTLNVQHVESRKEFIESIAGVVIREMVPDLILERASQIELIDIIPAELLKRLREGKVYIGPQSEIAAKNFFTEDRLTALREIALRFTAEKVDHDLHGMMIAGEHEHTKRWKTTERLMVAVSHSPYSQYLIRNTRRRAFKLDCPWIAVHVDNGSILEEKDNQMLAKNLALARDLGAEVITVTDPDIPKALERIVKYKNVTQLIVGRSPTTSILDFLTGGNLVNRLMRSISDIDIHIIHTPSAIGRKYRKLFSFTSHFGSYLLILIILGIITFGNAIALSYVGVKTIGFTYLLAILILSLFFNRGPILFAAALSTFIWTIGFHQYYVDNSTTSSDLNNNVFVFLYFLTAMITGVLSTRIKEREELLHQRENGTQAIYEIVKEIATAPSEEQIFKSVKEKLGRILNGTCEVMVNEQDGGLIFEENTSVALDEKEKAVAAWVFENGKEAGWTTETLPSVSCLYIPLKGHKEIVGVLAFCPKNPQKHLSIEENNLLHTAAQQLANYLERSISEERARHREYLDKIEKLHQTLFNSISHEFRNPLISIKNAVQHLKTEKSIMNIPDRETSVNEIENSSENLSHFVENVLIMAQLGTGFFSINKTINDIRELISACVTNLGKTLVNHKIKVNIQGDIPLLFFDFSLMEILVCNLILNAVTYSPQGSLIEIEAKMIDDNFRLAVKDQGPGIPPDQAAFIFKKFYRIPGNGIESVGLGLPIAKAISEMHNGTLEVENRTTGGAVFYLTLALNKQNGETAYRLKKL
jgi:two-component system, OmpR family, sensor histidine kinase KdpD